MGDERILREYIMTMKQKKILFLHGFFASGQSVPALTLQDAFVGRAQVLAPDLPLHPREALTSIRAICDREHPDLLVGNSCGAFYAQMIAPVVGIPALLGNPHFQMSEFLRERRGEQTYKAIRRDGKQQFVIDDALVDAFAEMEKQQFHWCNPYYRSRVWGLFGEKDPIAHFEPTFLEHYSQSFHFPGEHTPTPNEIATWYAPLAEKMMLQYRVPEDGIRYFRHFKGGLYRYIRTAFDSETGERMVVYQALYGEQSYWVRPEKMFFEEVERDGHTFSRFEEVERE